MNKENVKDKKIGKITRWCFFKISYKIYYFKYLQQSEAQNKSSPKSCEHLVHNTLYPSIPLTKSPETEIMSDIVCYKKPTFNIELFRECQGSVEFRNEIIFDVDLVSRM